jgi:hypothetical protein
MHFSPASGKHPLEDEYRMLHIPEQTTNLL